ncbi:mitochondrial carrier protein [Hokovirus HKV1]|uniref:Mitochondrial carrier protein n=1 Tax=Hokovirus HKV1 TaxID=1977638 RepID=A0A1V0SFC4_9VIRU|nr:mitochondrial carrier protein [Hokovirus HKV1]
MPHTEINNNIFNGLISGALGGVVISIVGHPFDTLKFMLQTQKTTSLKNMSIINLYKGFSSTLISQVCFRSTLFLSQNQTKYLLGGNNEIYHYFVAGAVGWGIGSLIECPFDVVKFQLQTNKNLKTKNCISNIYRNNGILGFYRGYSSHLLRNIPAGAINLGSYDLLRECMAKYESKNIKELSIYNNIFAGALSGCLFWLAVFPLDVIKSNMQSDNLDKKYRKHNNIIHCAKNIYKNGGIHSFYRGLMPCLFRAIPANGLMLYVVTLFNEKILVN